MTFPSTLFIDTCIFEEHNFNFDSKGIVALLNAIRNLKLTLLLPDPTQREIRKHLEVRSREASAFLQKAQKAAPFLASLDEWNAKFAEEHFRHILWGRGFQQFEGSYKNFSLQQLNYNGVQIETVMNWYTFEIPPFESGKVSDSGSAVGSVNKI